MDFRQNSVAPSRPTTPTTSSVDNLKTDNKKPKRGDNDSGRWTRLLSIIILFGVAILLLAVAFVFTRSSGGNEYKLVDSKKYQAVFLNNGQVYFGKVAALNNEYFNLKDVYYLTQNTTTDKNGQTAADGNYTLVKLGCQQIHNPYDQMVVNRDQVTFWENLNDSGTVVTKIKEFKKNFPNGPDCSQVSTQTQASDNANTQGAANPNDATNPEANKQQ